MNLEWWNPSIGCTGRKDQVHEAYIRVFGLPFHSWTEEILKRVGDSCGGFVAMDKGTTLRMDLLWSRILVKKNGMGKPSFLNLLVRVRSYELQIWWEIEPRVSEVYPRRNSVEGVRSDSKEEDERRTRVAGQVSTEREERFHIFREMQKVDL